MGNIRLGLQWELSYTVSMDQREIAIARLEQLGIGPVEVVTQSGIAMDRHFVRDLVEGKKKSVSAASLPKLAEVLRLDLNALARGELVPIDEADDSPLVKAQVDEIARIMRSVDEDGRDSILGKARSIEIAAQQREQTQEAPQDRPKKGRT